MQIKSFGCSFIFGSDLSDTTQTWPARLAKSCNCDYECLARPGAGNLQIAEQVLTHSAESNSEFFVIGWTWIDRFDYASPIDNSWHTILPVDQSSLGKYYYKQLHSEYRDKLTNLITIKSVIDTLLQKKISFLMTYMDELLFDQRWHVNPAILELQQYIRPYMTTFEGMTFLDWSRKNKFAESVAWHPLEQAHESAANYMIKIFDPQKINDSARPVGV